MLPKTLPAEVSYAGGQDSCLEDEDDEPICRVVLLPSPKVGGQSRVIEITCSICLKNYCVGDCIITAAIDDGCPHAFHESCITEWLIRGNMRCPVCLRRFDSPSNIKNQKEVLRGQSVETDISGHAIPSIDEEAPADRGERLSEDIRSPEDRTEES